MRETYTENNIGSVTTKTCFLEQLYSGIMAGKRATLDFPPRLGMNRMEIKTEKKTNPESKCLRSIESSELSIDFVFYCGEGC